MEHQNNSKKNKKGFCSFFLRLLGCKNKYKPKKLEVSTFDKSEPSQANHQHTQLSCWAPRKKRNSKQNLLRKVSDTILSEQPKEFSSVASSDEDFIDCSRRFNREDETKRFNLQNKKVDKSLTLDGRSHILHGDTYEVHTNVNDKSISVDRPKSSLQNQKLDSFKRCLSVGSVARKSQMNKCQLTKVEDSRNSDKDSNLKLMKYACSVNDVSDRNKERVELREKLVELMASKSKKSYKNFNDLKSQYRDENSQGNYVFLTPINEISDQRMLKESNSLCRSSPLVNSDLIDDSHLSSCHDNFQRRFSTSNRHRQSIALIDRDSNRSRSRIRNISRRYNQPTSGSTSNLNQLQSNVYSSIDNIHQYSHKISDYLHRNKDNYVYLTSRKEEPSRRPQSYHHQFTTNRCLSKDPSTKLERDIIRTSKSSDYYHMNVIMSKSSANLQQPDNDWFVSDTSTGSDNTQIYYSIDV